MTYQNLPACLHNASVCVCVYTHIYMYLPFFFTLLQLKWLCSRKQKKIINKFGYCWFWASNIWIRSTFTGPHWGQVKTAAGEPAWGCIPWGAPGSSTKSDYAGRREYHQLLERDKPTWKGGVPNLLSYPSTNPLTEGAKATCLNINVLSTTRRYFIHTNSHRRLRYPEVIKDCLKRRGRNTRNVCIAPGWPK